MREPDWQTKDGAARLYLGDCREVLAEIEGWDCVFVDPPYGLNGGSGTLGKRGRAAQVTWIDTDESVRNVHAPAFHVALEKANYRRGAVTPGTKCHTYFGAPSCIGMIYQPAAVGCCSWGRATCQPVLFFGKDPRAGKHLDSIVFKNTLPAEDNGHPTPKPLNVMLWIVQRISLAGEVIMDHEMGSGTTGVAALRMGRKFIGIEIEPKYFEIAKRRIAAESRRFALLEGGA